MLAFDKAAATREGENEAISQILSPNNPIVTKNHISNRCTSPHVSKGGTLNAISRRPALSHSHRPALSLSLCALCVLNFAAFAVKKIVNRKVR